VGLLEVTLRSALLQRAGLGAVCCFAALVVVPLLPSQPLLRGENPSTEPKLLACRGPALIAGTSGP